MSVLYGAMWLVLGASWLVLGVAAVADRDWLMVGVFACASLALAVSGVLGRRRRDTR